MRSPQTTGQECPRPGIGVFQRTFLPAGTSQVVGGNWPSATPVAPGPRNCGQFKGVVTTPGVSSTALGATDSSFGFDATFPSTRRSEEHTSELQSRFDLVCRLLLEKK